MLATYPEATAFIEIRRVDGPIGTARHEYAWLPTRPGRAAGDVAMIDRYSLQQHCGLADEAAIGQVVTVGPYRLRLVAEYDLMLDTYYVMRDGWQARAYALWYRAAGPLRRFYQRLIVTAQVWGLARYQQYVEPSWRDLHIVRWWRKGRA